MLVSDMGNEDLLLAENKELRASLLTTTKALDTAQLKIDQLDSYVRILLSKQYGKKSEKIDTEQLGLFGNATATQEESAETQMIPAHRRKKQSKKEGRPAFPDHLPRNEFHSELSGDDLVCPTCEAALKDIGADICETGHFRPAVFTVNRIHKHKYACPNGHLVKTAPDPEGHLPRCKYDASIHAAIVTSRFGDHLPYYRQEAIFKRMGVAIPRQSMGDMAQRVSEIAKSILDQMQIELIAEKVIQADETSITVLKEGQKGTEKGWMWVYRCAQKVLFDFTMTRGPNSPNRILQFFLGILQVDGWYAYNKVIESNQLIRAGCWAHVRRKFHDCFTIIKKEPVIIKEAAAVIYLISRLYRLEAAMKKRRDRLKLSDEEFFALRVTVRARRSRGIVKKLDDLIWDYKEAPSFLPKSLLGKAVKYARNQWPTLETFLEHGEVEIDNNGAERAIRPVAVGRKNWLVVGNEKGGRTAARLYSLIESCKAIGVNPQAYLEDVIARAQSMPQEQIHTLTPWAWKANLAQD